MCVQIKADKTVRGILQIKGETYGLEYSPEWYPSRQVVLTKLSDPDSSYQVELSHSFSDALTTGSPNRGWECDCPDFLNRHRGTGSEGCKHIKAVVAESDLLAHFDTVESAESEGESMDDWNRDDDAYARMAAM